MAHADRCVPEVHVGVSDADATSAANTFKILGSPERLRLLRVVQSAPANEICVCDLVDHLDLPHAAVSRHLDVLVAGGLVRRERRGGWEWYTAIPGELEAARSTLD